MNLEGRVAFVTGAGSGIGRAAAMKLAVAGAKIAALDHTEENVRETVAAIRDRGGAAITLAADVSDSAAMKAAYERVAQEWGRLDVVFANAGINGVWAPIDELQDEEWTKTLTVNLTGTFLTVKYALPLLKQNGGSVIVTSSVNGTRIFSNAGASAYSTSKAGQVAFTKMAALELAKHRIRVNVVCPGAIETAIEDSTEKRHIERAQEPIEFPEGAIPLTDGAPGKADQVADLVLFLASDASSHISGTEIWIDGASSLLQG